MGGVLGVGGGRGLGRSKRKGLKGIGVGGVVGGVVGEVVDYYICVNARVFVGDGDTFSFSSLVMLERAHPWEVSLYIYIFC